MKKAVAKKQIKPGAAVTRRPKDNLPELLPPAVDVVFKHLFGDERNKDILAAFLTEVLGFKVTPKSITYIDPHLRRRYADSKLGIIDVRLRLGGRRIINIEMQVGKLNDIRGRIEYYISDTVSGQLRKGDKYLRITPVVMILISRHRLLRETERFHSEFGTLEKTEHFEFHGLRTIHVFELSKLPKRGGGRLADWLRFIKSKKKEDFVTLAQECRHLARALNALADTSANAKVRADYKVRLMEARDKMAEIDYAIDEGRAKGRKEGRVEERKEILSLINKGASLTEIKKMLSPNPKRTIRKRRHP